MNGVADVLAVAVQASIPVIVIGEPGTGKTSYMHALAAALGWPIEVVIASIHDPTDFGGVPIVDRVTGDVVLRNVLPAVRRLTAVENGILFFDELSTAPLAVQAALLRVIFEGVVGEVRLAAGVRRVAAANPPELAAGGYDLSAPLANRLAHLTWTVDTRHWVQGMVDEWPSPVIPRLAPSWEAAIPAQRALVASFVRARPALLLAVPKEATAQGRAWPSPRTWDMAARMLAALDKAFTDKDERRTMAVAACVGEGATIEFLGWLRDLDLPDPEALLADPRVFVVPKRGDQLYAVLSAVAAAVVRQPTPERFLAGWRIMAMAAKAASPDVAASATMSLQRLARRDPTLPHPKDDLKAFVPMLRAMSMLGS